MCCDRSIGRILVPLLLLMVCTGNVLAQSPSKSSDTEKAFSSTDWELIGLWSGEGEMIEFRSDGSCQYGGELYPYKLSQGHLIIEVPGGSVVFPYQLKEGQLLLTAQGHQSVYSRVPVHPETKHPATDKRNPPDLVGQWCYLKSSSGSFSGRCIILNADGTYRYTSEVSRSVQPQEMSAGTSSQESDSGTWYVEGDRLYYQSKTSGSGSYQLERRNHPVNVNDPMIVLDNEPFVTTTQRPPWR